MINFLVFVYFTLASVFFTWPLIFNLTNKIIGLYDELLITWIINWVIHALTTNPFLLFQANIFYPYKNTLAYSDIHLANAIFAWPFVKIFKEPILAFNINLLAGFVFTGFFTYLLVKHLTKNPLAGVISETLLTFSTIHLNYLGHLQLFCLQYFILAIFLFFKFLEKKSFSKFFIFFIISILATLNDFLIGYFLTFSIFVTSLFKKELKWFLVFIVCLGILCLPFFLPYFSVSREFHYVRPIRDIVHFSLQPEDLIYPSNMTRLENFLLNIFKLKPTEPWMKTTPGYLGLAFNLMGIWTVIRVIRGIGEIRKRRGKNLLTLLIIGSIGLILSFGPVMHWGRETIHKPFIIPLPYAILYYLLPGFSGFRTPSRFILLFAFSFAVIIGIVFVDITKRWQRVIKSIFAIFICLLVFWEFNFPLILHLTPKIKDYPKVYSYLNLLDKNAPILEMPILNWDAYELIQLETKREFYSTLNFRPMVNGYSGFTPPEREILAKKIMLEFPSTELINWLKKIKAKYIIFHKNDYELLEKNNFLVNGKKFRGLEKIVSELSNFKNDIFLVKEIDSDLIYEFR